MTTGEDDPAAVAAQAKASPGDVSTNTKTNTMLPVPDATLPFWRTELHPFDEARSTRRLPVAPQDVVIIGTGFAGAACAYYLTQGGGRTPAQRITMLEAREACSGATGRNGGHCRPDLHAGFAGRRERHGLEAASAVAQFEADNLAAVTALIRAEHILCDFEEVASGNVYLRDDMAAEARRNLEDMARLGCPTASFVQFYGHPAEAEMISQIKGARAVSTFRAATMWPYKFVMRLLTIAVGRGINLQTQTPVLSISDSADAEGYWTVTTNRGDVRARKVVFATNGYTPGVLPEYKQAIHPVRGVCSRITVTSAPEAQGELQSLVPWYSPSLADYQVNRSDGSYVVGGAWGTCRTQHPDQWLDVLDDSKTTPAADGYFDNYMQRTFAGWEKAETKVDRYWSGIMGYTSDGEPHVGKVPSKDGLYICAGFNGHGMPLILLSAKGLVKMMTENCSFSETGVPSIFETSVERQQLASNII